MATYNKIISTAVTELTISDSQAVTIEEAVSQVLQRDAGVGDTDFTSEANDAVANDVPCIPSPHSVGDAILVGSTHKFEWILFDIGTAGVGAYQIGWKYWDGSAWQSSNEVYDATLNLKRAGLARVHIVIPDDWAKDILVAKNLYRISGEITGLGTMTTQPLATQIWVGPPVPRSRILGGGSFHAKGKSPSGKIVNVSRYTTTQTLVVANHHVACDTDSGAFTVTLPAGIKGTEYRIGNTGTSGNNLTVAPDGTDLLIGVNSNFTLSDGETLHLVYEPTEGWF